MKEKTMSKILNESADETLLFYQMQAVMFFLIRLIRFDC